jgi:SAM-dependent methyltransferase
MPLPDDAFDVLVSVVGVQFTPRHAATAAELVRVLRPGGRFVLANWTPAGFIGQVFKTMSPYMPKPPAGRELSAAVGRRGPRPLAVPGLRDRAVVRDPHDGLHGGLARRVRRVHGRQLRPGAQGPRAALPGRAAGTASAPSWSRCASAPTSRRTLPRAVGVPRHHRAPGRVTRVAAPRRSWRGRRALSGTSARGAPRSIESPASAGSGYLNCTARRVLRSSSLKTLRPG